jgi:NAD(P)-dependent dehydrogenase (short-subunit alcohol dehydrogenase family)
MEGRFVNHSVVITGATGALGTAVVDRLLHEGATVHATWVDEQEKEGFPHADHERVHLHQVDLLNGQEVIDFFEGLDELWASIHVAGGFAMKPIEKTSLDDLRQIFDINTSTCFLACREAVRAFRRLYLEGRIVNIAAKPVEQPMAGLSGYTISKAGVAALTRSLAEETKEEGILVNAVSPSIMDTPANREAMPDADHDRWPKVEQVAEAIAFLASPSNELTTGEVLPVYGRV